MNFTTLNIYYLVIVIVDPLKVQYERGLDANGYVQNRESSKDGIFEHLHQHEGGPKRQISKECSHDDAAIEHGNSNVGACHIQIVDI